MKEIIIKEAIKQMKSGGYDNLNFAAIAEEIGTSRTNLHHHFANKEGLALAATKSYIDQEKLIIDQFFEDHDGNIRVILKKLENYLIQLMKLNSSSNSCIMSQLIHDQEAPAQLREIAIERSLKEEEMIERQLLKAKKKGSIRKEINCKKTATRIMMTMFGINQIGIFKDDKDDLSRCIRGALTSIIE